jgi:hypothetical protein
MLRERVCLGNGNIRICAHKCVDCGGSSICDHGRRKASCKDCGGSGICDHKSIANIAVGAVHVFMIRTSTSVSNANGSKGNCICRV